MRKRIFSLLLSAFLAAPAFAYTTTSALNPPCRDFSNMKKLWCTVDYRHWSPSYANQVGYSEVDFYLYLDEDRKMVYNQEKQEMKEIVDFNDKEIKFVNKYHADKRTVVENYTLNRYTGRARGAGTIRHDYGKWASLTYENREFNASGQCAMVNEEKKF